MSGVLPLPLTAFEQYFVTDDRPGYRMTFVIDQTFDGEIDREAFEVGLSQASQRNPLLNALCERARWGRVR